MKEENGEVPGGGTQEEFGPEYLKKMDLESIPMDEAFSVLQSSREGITSEEAERRIGIFGRNKLEEKKESEILKFLSYMNNPLSWVMEAAAVVAIVISNGQGEPPDWEDFIGIVFLLLVNATLSYVEERNAGKAAASLMANLALNAKVLRSGEWTEVPSPDLVPGDIIMIKGGDIIPADCRLLEGEPVKIDQSALTGEALPVTREAGDVTYSGSTCKQGELPAVVTATGKDSFLGRAATLADGAEASGHFQRVLAMIGAFCIVLIVICIIIEIIVMFAIQKRPYRRGIDNILVLLVGGIPIAMPTVLSVTMAIGSHHLASQGAVVKRITAIEEMAGMDILCSDKTGTLTLNQLSVDTAIIEVFLPELTQDDVLILAARAARTDHPDAIDKAMLDTVGDIEKIKKGVREEIHYLPFNPVDKRAASTYILEDGRVERACKGAPEQILNLAWNKEAIEGRVHDHINQYADRGLRSLAVARQMVPEGREVGATGGGGSKWEFVGLLPLLDPPRHDTSETIASAISLGVSVKMITGDQLAIGKEMARRLGMGSDMYPASVLTHPENLKAGTTLEDLVENADGFAGVFPEHKFNIVRLLQKSNHLTGMTGDGVNDAPALKAANVGIAVAGSTDAARDAADIVLTEPGLSVIISAIIRSRVIFQRMRNYVLYDTAGTVRIVVGFMLLALIWKFDMPPFLVLIIAFLNNGTIMAISKDRVRPSQNPDSWGLVEIFGTCITMGFYQALFTFLFYMAVEKNYFSDLFGVEHIGDLNVPEQFHKQASVIYLQVSVSNQAMIFVTRARRLSWLERPGMFLLVAFGAAQLSATLIAVYANWGFVPILGCGWGWAGVVWLYCFIFYFPLDFVKLATEKIFRLLTRKPLHNVAAIQAEHIRKAKSGKNILSTAPKGETIIDQELELSKKGEKGEV